MCYLLFGYVQNAKWIYGKWNIHVMEGYASQNVKISPYLRLMLTTYKSYITVSFKWYHSPFLHFTHAKFDDNYKCYDNDYCELQVW